MGCRVEGSDEQGDGEDVAEKRLSRGFRECRHVGEKRKPRDGRLAKEVKRRESVTGKF